MKIGFVGLGKLGLPVAVTVAMRGHDVMGYDLDPARMRKSPQAYKESGPDGKGDFNEWLANSTVRFGSLAEVVAHSEILFVCVQTPHDPRYEGVSALPEERVDFDYSHLVAALQSIVPLVAKRTVVSIISTVLPGTIEREIAPICHTNAHVRLVYNPSFIAMGTVMRDFLHPEFVLMGGEDPHALFVLEEFYMTLTGAPHRVMSVASAEMTKVCYNTFISLKIAFANTVMEACDHVRGADCTDVMDALTTATVRLISPAYLTPGMGDGGGCHPRDNIAMSWFARSRRLSFDFFEAGMQCRENQTRWLCEKLVMAQTATGLPIVILGYAFKPETNIVTGSPALLAWDILRREHDIAAICADDSVGASPSESEVLGKPAVFLIGCRHQRYADLAFAPGSVVIDPHRIIPQPKSQDYAVRSIGGKCRTLPR